MSSATAQNTRRIWLIPSSKIIFSIKIPCGVYGYISSCNHSASQCKLSANLRGLNFNESVLTCSLLLATGMAASLELYQLRMRKIRIAIVGVGNCASSLVQGINFYNGGSTSTAPVSG